MFATASENGIIELRNDVSVQSINQNKVTLEQRSEVHTLAFSPDSRTLVGGSKDGSIDVWDTSTQRHITTLKGHSSVVSSVDFSPDGVTLVSESEEGTICLWNTHTGQSDTIFTEHLTRIRSIKFSPDGQTLMSINRAHSDEWHESNRSSDNDTLHLWEIGTGIRKATFTAHSYHIGFAEFSPDSRTLAIWSKTGTLELWDVETCLPKITFTEKVEEVTSIIFSPDGRMLASWNSNSIVIWDVETRKRKTTLTDELDDVKSVTFSPSGCTIISRSGTKTGSHHSDSADIIHLWDVETGKRKIIPADEGSSKVKPILLSSDNSTLISISTSESLYKDKRGYTKKNGTIHLSDVETGARKTTLVEERMGTVTSVFFSSDNSTLISVSKDDTDRYSSRQGDIIRLWDIETSICKTTLTEKLYNVKSILLSSDNSTLISVSEDETGGYSNRYNYNIIGLSDVGTGTLKATFTEDRYFGVESVSLSSDNRTLAGRDREGTIRVWDVETGTCKAIFTKFTDIETDERDPIGNITYAALSPDGSIIASGNDVGTILLWEIPK